MLKKLVSSIAAVIPLLGCGGGEKSASGNPKDMTAEIIKDLSLTDKVSEVEDRVIPGLFFFEQDTVSESSFYAADKLADCVGVFRTSNPESCEKCVKTYLETRKAQLEMYAPSEVFKVDNAVLESTEDTVVMIVCDDLESAGKEAKKLLGQ